MNKFLQYKNVYVRFKKDYITTFEKNEISEQFQFMFWFRKCMPDDFILTPMLI